jgi:hypothetical protein
MNQQFAIYNIMERKSVVIYQSLERLNRLLPGLCLAGSDDPIPLIDDEDLEF